MVCGIIQKIMRKQPLWINVIVAFGLSVLFSFPLAGQVGLFVENVFDLGGDYIGFGGGGGIITALVGGISTYFFLLGLFAFILLDAVKHRALFLLFMLAPPAPYGVSQSWYFLADTHCCFSV